ncbi:hypothetical protein SPI_07010 [Niveomyces insectorum RCEF 264]|uniref:Uncharacterized protein n=1 Tax=Niveomyces insectorum RCEF 264 TaxID=1081102 RepID=A0A167QZE9_9HYPO|nr:hypothetical protein SPI_07010 [Niveomyces insectorum RCEF 264]
MQPFSFLSLCLFAVGVLGHIPHIDNGSHESLSTAWEFPETNKTRVLLVTFQCPSVVAYSKVTVNDLEEDPYLVIGVGIPNVTTVYDFRPSLWVIGANVTTPPGYQTDAEREQAGVPSGASSAFLPEVPRGFNAVEFPTASSDVFFHWAEEGGAVAGVGFIEANITLSGPGDVYFALQPSENRLAKAYIALGKVETAEPEPGSASEVDTEAWFTSVSYPKMGQRCVAWSA